MLNGGSMVWGFCVYFVYMIPLETDVLRKHRFQKPTKHNQAGPHSSQENLHQSYFTLFLHNNIEGTQ